MLQEYFIWLSLITVGLAIANYAALYLVALWSVYFITVRLLEKIQLRDLDKKPVLITGCDSGFGFGLALKCLKDKMPVFAACFNDEGQRRLRDEARKIANGDELLCTFNLDVRSEESLQKARELVESRLQGYKGLHGVVSNAGIGDLRGFDDWISPAHYQRMWDVNTLGVIRTVHTFKHLVKRAKGRFINVSSITGKFPMPAIGPYSTSKYAIQAYSDVLRMEMIPWGVKVCVLEPGFFKTPQANPQASMDDAARVWERAPQAVKDEYGEEWFRWGQNAITDYLEYKCKPGAELVVDAYHNALTSIFPRLRYQVGLDSTVQFTGLSYLPTRWQDWLVRGYWRFIARPPAFKVQY